jgi:long-chain acyl-CoA synthetase
MKSLQGKKTIAQLFNYGCKEYRDRIALRKKIFGIWQSYTWKDHYEKVKYFALGMRCIGFERGTKVAIIGDNEPEWVWAMLATIVNGGILIAGCYPDSQSSEIKHVIDHSEVNFVVCEDQEQVDKLLELKPELTNIKRVIYWDPKGLWYYEDPWLMDYEEVSELGRTSEQKTPGVFEEGLEKCNEDDLAAIYYTSGTSGLPKGVMWTNRALVAASESILGITFPREGDDFFCLSPLPWIAELMTNILPSMACGAIVNFPEEPETVPIDLREIGYQVGFVGIRAIEAQISEIQVKIRGAGWLKRSTYDLFMPWGFKIIDAKAKAKRPNLLLRLFSLMGYWALFRHLQDHLGYKRSRILVTGGAALAQEAFNFIHAIGIPLLNAYGMTEMNPISSQNLSMVNGDSVGVPVSNVEVKISPEGEVLAKGPNMSLGYYKDPERTKQIIDKEGWLHTGDAGFINEAGELVIIDRVADLMKLARGVGFSPLFIENKLKFSPYIREAVVLGHEREFVAALVAIDFVSLGKWAEDNQIAYTTFTDLSQKKEVYDLIREEIQKKVNPTLPEESRIKRFTLLAKELDADDAELTRTRKLRRKFVGEKYRKYIEALYGNKEEYMIKYRVKYQDGREADIQSLVKIKTLG